MQHPTPPRPSPPYRSTQRDPPEPHAAHSPSQSTSRRRALPSRPLKRSSPRLGTVWCMSDERLAPSDEDEPRGGQVEHSVTHGAGPHVPALAVIPGGSTNVFARALGLPNDAVEATGALLRHLRERRTRLVSVGAAQADESNGIRYFTFTAGYGFDAAVTREV